MPTTNLENDKHDDKNSAYRAWARCRTAARSSRSLCARGEGWEREEGGGSDSASSWSKRACVPLASRYAWCSCSISAHTLRARHEDGDSAAAAAARRGGGAQPCCLPEAGAEAATGAHTDRGTGSAPAAPPTHPCTARRIAWRKHASCSAAPAPELSAARHVSSTSVLQACSRGGGWDSSASAAPTHAPV